MSEWLRLTDGQCINMNHVTMITVPEHSAPGPPGAMSLHMHEGQVIELRGANCAAVEAYLNAGVQHNLEIKSTGPPPSRPRHRD